MRVTTYLVLFIGTLLFGLQYYYQVNEDAWISFKYARNLVEGYGLVSNPGDATQEGYSNLLLVLLLAFFNSILNIDIVHTAKIIGLVSVGAIVASVPLFVRLVFSSVYPVHYLAWLIILPIGFSQYMSFWATQGLETSLYALMIWVIVYFTLQVVLKSTYQKIWLLAILGFMSLNVRPEGLMNFPVSLGVIIFSAFLDQRLDKQFFKELIQGVILFIILVTALFSFKWCYFGDVLANPSHVKLATAIWLNPYPYFIDYFKTKGIVFTVITLISLCGGLISALFSLSKGHFIPVKIISVCLAFLASQTFFIYYSGGDYMMHARFLITHYPLLVLTIVWATTLMLKQYWTWNLLLGGVLLYSAVFKENVSDPKWWSNGVNWTSPTVIHEVIHSGHYVSAEILKKKMANTTGYYATSEFGYIPYHVAAKGLDMMGLNQKEIAHNFRLYGFEEATYANRDFILSKKPVTILAGRYYQKENGELVLHESVGWFLKPYMESDFFKRHYHTDIPHEYQEWIFNDWNNSFHATHSIHVGEQIHYDKLMYGFKAQGAQLRVAPLARVLLRRRSEDNFLTINGYIDDIDTYPRQQNQIGVYVNHHAVGDQLFAQQVVNQSGKFSFKMLLDDLVFPQEQDTLMTLRGTATNSSLQFSYWLESIYFSKE